MTDLLYLVHRIPYPPNKGDKIRSWHQLHYLARHFRVHLGCFVDDADDLVHVPTVAALCASSCFIRQSRPLATLRALSGLASGQALSLPYYRDRRLQRWVDALLAGGQVRDALVFSGPMAQYLDDGAGHALHRVIDFVDVDSEKWREYATGRRWPGSWLYLREADRLLAYERHIARQFDAATFVSSAEAALFRQRAALPQREFDYIGHVANGVDAAYFTPCRAHQNPYPAGARVLVLSGAMDYWPNVEAACWFVRQVWPALRARFPGLLFCVAGSRPARQVTALADVPGVIVTGTVTDMRPYLAHAALAVAPLRIARGVQNKVLEAMSMQKTVLASPQALAGINAQVGREVLAARDAGEFIELASRVLAGQFDLGAAARARIVQDYDWQRNLKQLGALFGVRAGAGNHSGAAAPWRQP